MADEELEPESLVTTICRSDLEDIWREVSSGPLPTEGSAFAAAIIEHIRDLRERIHGKR